MVRFLGVGLIAAGLLSGCNPTPPVLEYASENRISYKYNAYGTGSTLTPEVQDLAEKHCNKYGKISMWMGARTNGWTSEEIHDFECYVPRQMTEAERAAMLNYLLLSKR